MLRAAMVAMLAAALAGCWMSEKRLFGPADFVAPPGLEGNYVSEDGSGTLKATVVLSVGADRLIEGVSTPVGGDEPQQTSHIGFIPIAGGSGQYYLMVDRSPERTEGDLYFIGRMTEDFGLEAFWPQCAGTPEIAGMTREKAEPIDEDVCTFTSREAVMRAALEAEKQLSARHMFEPHPAGRLKKSDESDPADGDYDEATGETDFTEGDPFFE